MKLWCCVGGQVKHYVDYQLGVDKGKLTAVANLEIFRNSLRRLIYLYQLQVDNQHNIIKVIGVHDRRTLLVVGVKI